MKTKISNEKLVRPLIILAYIVLGIIVFRVFMDRILGWIAPFLIAFVLSRFVIPLKRVLGKKLKNKGFISVLSTVLVLLCFFAVVGIIFYIIYQQLLPFFEQMGTKYREIIDKIKDGNIAEIGILATLPESVGEALEKTIRELPSKIDFVSLIVGPAIGIVTSLPLVLLTVVATVVSTFFFVIYDEKIRLFIRKLIPNSFREKVERVYKHLFSSLIKWLKAQCILCSVCFVELFIGFLILGFDFAFTLALLVAFVDFLPVLGAGAVLIPWAVIALVTGRLRIAIGAAVIYVVILIVRNLLEPHVVGGQLGLHPFVMLVTMYLGFRMYGFIGMFIVPLIMITVIRLNEWGYIHLWKVGDESDDEAPAEGEGK
ncbi:MAG: sporulation integral membrane protein YtvI [Clostridia bacterium]|nr:sporulation integral membrane protein YtvI [Clostridia bacterium]